jgi:hypothetical protein
LSFPWPFIASASTPASAPSRSIDRLCRLSRPGETLEHLRVDLARHEGVAKLIMLAVRLALLLERLARLLHLLLFGKAPELLRGNQDFCHGDPPAVLADREDTGSDLTWPILKGTKHVYDICPDDRCRTTGALLSSGVACRRTPAEITA